MYKRDERTNARTDTGHFIISRTYRPAGDNKQYSMGRPWVSVNNKQYSMGTAWVAVNNKQYSMGTAWVAVNNTQTV